MAAAKAFLTLGGGAETLRLVTWLPFSWAKRTRQTLTQKVVGESDADGDDGAFYGRGASLLKLLLGGENAAGDV